MMAFSPPLPSPTHHNKTQGCSGVVGFLYGATPPFEGGAGDRPGPAPDGARGLRGVATGIDRSHSAAVVGKAASLALPSPIGLEMGIAVGETRLQPSRTQHATIQHWEPLRFCCNNRHLGEGRAYTQNQSRQANSSSLSYETDSRDCLRSALPVHVNTHDLGLIPSATLLAESVSGRGSLRGWYLIPSAPLLAESGAGYAASHGIAPDRPLFIHTRPTDRYSPLVSLSLTSPPTDPSLKTPYAAHIPSLLLSAISSLKQRPRP